VRERCRLSERDYSSSVANSHRRVRFIMSFALLNQVVSSSYIINFQYDSTTFRLDCGTHK